MEKSFKSVVDNSRSILILLPVNPLFDQVAASLSLYLALEGKKDVVVSCPTQMVVDFNRLVGVNKISDEIGNKNLVLRFADYPAENIERVSYDIENQQFRLTVIPKPQMEPPKKNQVSVNYAGVSADTTILIGGSSPKDFPALSTNELAETKLVHIGVEDLHVPSDRNVISLARPSSSICQIMADYVKELEGGFHPDIASNLISGIVHGSKNFTNSNVNADTFKLAAELMQAGGKIIDRGQKPQLKFPMGSGGKLPFPMNVKLPTDIMPEEETHEKPEGESVAPNQGQGNNPPQSWLKPKIYKGTSVS